MSPGKSKGLGKGKGKKKGKKKDARNKGATWCLKDVEWDADGCLSIKNEDLAEQIYNAIWVTKDFCIVMGDPDYDAEDPEGGGGGGKVNAMCPC